MAAPFTPQALTANRLRDGDVVYWDGTDWAERFAQAAIYNDKASADAALAAAAAFVKGRVVVNPYLFPVTVAGGAAAPVEEREIIRAAGPSVRTDLGKQAEESFDVSI